MQRLTLTKGRFTHKAIDRKEYPSLRRMFGHLHGAEMGA